MKLLYTLSLSPLAYQQSQPSSPIFIYPRKVEQILLTKVMAWVLLFAVCNDLGNSAFTHNKQYHFQFLTILISHFLAKHSYGQPYKPVTCVSISSVVFWTFPMINYFQPMHVRILKVFPLISIIPNLWAHVFGSFSI